MGEVEFNKEDESNVKIVDGGDYKEPGGGIRKPTQEEIDEYKIHRIVVMIIFGLVVVILLLLIVILIATTDGCKSVNEDEFNSTQLPWWKSGVMYNIYPRSFKDSMGDGIGDFKGIVKKLDYLKELGVNILYLSSVFKIDTKVDYGYSVIDFKETNTEYGSLSDFEDLVKAAHDKEMKVIIEFVPCDTSIKHKWFNESSYRSGKTDWYIWQKNVSGLAGSWSKINGRFYLHQTKYTEKASLNWTNDEVKAELDSVLKFWLDKKVDGFRVVSVQRLLGEHRTEADWSKIHTTVQRWQNYTKQHNPDSVLIGSSHPANLKLYGTKDLPELDIVVNFNLVDGGKAHTYTAANFKEIIKSYVQEVKPNWPSWALTSWVHGRVGSNVDSKLATSLQALLLTLPGTPIVFYGDEIGMKDVKNPSNMVEQKNRAPMQWNNSLNGGFTTNQSTWFGKVGNNSYTNAKDDRLGIKKKFIEIVKLRKDNTKALLGGPLSNFTVEAEGSVLAYTFKGIKPSFVIAMNFGKTKETIDLLSKLGVKKGSLKYQTDDKKPDKFSMDAVEVPPKVFYLFKVLENT